MVSVWPGTFKDLHALFLEVSPRVPFNLEHSQHPYWLYGNFPCMKNLGAEPFMQKDICY